MTTAHHWFASGHYFLLGHTNLPRESGQTGVVIVPPLGWEDVCAYRPLRFLAHALAENGIPVLRYDLPGTGDSSGEMRDPGLLETWIRSVADAAGELKLRSGVAEVALLGVGFGAMLAVASSRRMRFRSLILWGGFSSGRALLRALRAYAEMERAEYARPGVAVPPSPEPGLEAGGFLIVPELQRDLEALDLTVGSHRTGQRALVLTSDGVPADAKLVRSLAASGCDVRTETGEGYGRMMSLPNEALAPPPRTIASILNFVRRAPGTSGIAYAPDEGNVTISLGGSRIREGVHSVGTTESSMFGILSEPSRFAGAGFAGGTDCCVVFLNAGGVRHIGPNRMWVEAARRHAARGVLSLRLDLLGIGESDGEVNLDIPALYREELVEQVESAMTSLRCDRGIERFILIGLCAGAFWAFHAALHNSQVCSAILMNPRLFFWDPDVDRRRLIRRDTERLTRVSEWGRLFRRGLQPEGIARTFRAIVNRARFDEETPTAQIPARRMAEAWKKIERNGTRIALILNEGEPLLREMEQERQMPPNHNRRVNLYRISNAGHTFRPRWSQNHAHDLIDREIESALRRAPAARSAG